MPSFSKLAHSDSTPLPFYNAFNKGENAWRDLYPWLLSSGYRLRPCYQHNSPEALEHTITAPKRQLTRRGPYDFCPYGSRDATQIASGTQVALQRVGNSEVEVTRYLQRINDSFISVLPVLDILEHPTDSSIRILVQPLFRSVNEPGFETIGEVLDFIYQAFKGLQHLHERNIFVGLLGMLKFNPIVMVPSPSMYPDSYNFMFPRYNPSQTQRVRPAGPRTIFQPTYYWMVCDISRRVDPKDPETKDLFAKDVAALGRLIQKMFLTKWRGIDSDNMRHLQGTGIYSPRSLTSLSSYPEHSNSYPDTDSWGLPWFRTGVHHPLGNPHLNPLTDLYPPTHPKYERSPLTRLVRNMAWTVNEEKPTIVEATRALERILITMVPSSPSRNRSGNPTDEKSPMSMVSDSDISTVMKLVNPFYLSYAPATSRRGVIFESFGPDVSIIRLIWRVWFVYLTHPPIEALVDLNKPSSQSESDAKSRLISLLSKEKRAKLSEVSMV